MSSESFYPQPVRKTLLHDGTEIAYVEKGTGPATLLFLHGLSSNLLSWHQNFEALAQHYRCIAIDLPGNGLSTNSPTGDYSLHYFARCVLHFIGEKGLQNVCLVGHSMGAQIALTAALEAPAAVEKLILVSPAGIEQFSAWEQALGQTTFFFADFFQRPEDSMKQFYEGAFYKLPQGSRRLLEACLEDYHRHGDAAYRKMLTQCISSMFRHTVIEKLGQVRQPALLLFGDCDALIPNRLCHPQLSVQQLARTAEKLMPHARARVLPQAGHFVHWESAGDVNKAVMGFVG